MEAGALTCPICTDVFTDPVLVSCCGQSFCRDCLDSVLARQDACPFCRVPLLEGVDRVLPNRVLRSLLEDAMAAAATVATARSQAPLITSEEEPILGEQTNPAGDECNPNVPGASQAALGHARGTAQDALSGAPSTSSSSAGGRSAALEAPGAGGAGVPMGDPAPLILEVLSAAAATASGGPLGAAGGSFSKASVQSHNAWSLQRLGSGGSGGAAQTLEHRVVQRGLDGRGGTARRELLGNQGRACCDATRRSWRWLQRNEARLRCVVYIVLSFTLMVFLRVQEEQYGYQQQRVAENAP